MANKVLVFTLSLIMQLSLNATVDVSVANIHDIEANFIEQQESIVASDINQPIKDEVIQDVNTTQPTKDEQNKRVIDPNKPMVALTYDDGPSKYTAEILDILKENNSAATFFVLGMQVNKYDEVIVRMVEEGNQIGNHSYDHKRLTTLNDEELHNQINVTDNLIYKTALYKPFVMRPPYGSTNAELEKKLQKPVINWSVDTRDWESRNTEAIVDIVLKNVKDGDIILMHDLYKTSVEASKIVIPELIKRGYQLVTVSELSENKDIILKAGNLYYHMH